MKFTNTFLTADLCIPWENQNKKEKKRLKRFVTVWEKEEEEGGERNVAN